MPTPEELGLPWMSSGKSVYIHTYDEDSRSRMPYNNTVCNCSGSGYGSSKKDPWNKSAIKRAEFIVEACNNYHALLKRVYELEEDLGVEHQNG
jgi:hypothetical protein